jgi:hypothetical protein
MSKPSAASPAQTFPTWLLTVLKLYTEERVLNNGAQSPPDLPNESSATRFNRFWRWIVEDESINKDQIVDSDQAEKVRKGMRDEAYSVMMGEKWFMEHNRKWWVQQRNEMERLRREAKEKMKTMDDEDAVRAEGEPDDGPMSRSSRRVKKTRKDTPMVDVDGDEGMDDVLA